MVGILARFWIHESIILVTKSINLCESSILNSPENAENRDFESILNSLNRETWRPYGRVHNVTSGTPNGDRDSGRDSREPRQHVYHGKDHGHGKGHRRDLNESQSATNRLVDEGRGPRTEGGLIHRGNRGKQACHTRSSGRSFLQFWYQQDRPKKISE